MPSTLPCSAAVDKPQNASIRHLEREHRVILEALLGYITQVDAAKELGVSRQTIHHRMNRAAEGVRDSLARRKPGPKPQPTDPKAPGPSPREQVLIRENLCLQATKLLLLAWIQAAGLLLNLRHLRLPAEQKLSMVKWIHAFVAAGGSVKAFAEITGQDYGKLLGWRHETDGLSDEEALLVLTDKSSAVNRPKTPDHVVQAVVSLKRKHPSWSCRQIAHALGQRRRHPVQIGKSKVAEILREHASEPTKPGTSRKLHTFGARNLAVCVDFMHVQGGEITAKVCLLMDEATRFIVGWSVTKNTSSEQVFRLLCKASRRFGRPLMVKSDNGPEFRRTFTGLLARLGVFHLNSPRYYPQFNGKLERLNGKLRRYLAFLPPPTALWTLRRYVCEFVKEHNSLHTNENLGGLTPREAFARGAPHEIPSTTERIQVARDGDRLILRFTNRRGQRARRELRLG